MDIPVRKRRKQTDPKLFILIGICSVLLVALLIVAVSRSGNQTGNQDSHPDGDGALPALEVLEINSDNDPAVIRTSYVDLEFSYAFSDLLQVRAVDGKDVKSLYFYTVLDGAEYGVFYVIFGGTEGIRLGDLKVPNHSTTLPVFAQVLESGDTLTGEMLITYQAVRDCFNDVVVSLSKNEGYTPLR